MPENTSTSNVQPSTGNQYTFAGLQAHLNDISASICRAAPLDEVLAKIRSTLIEIGLFDRVGVLLYDAQTDRLLGVWGTNRDGSAADTHGFSMPIPEEGRSPVHPVVRLGQSIAFVPDITEAMQPSPDDDMYGVRENACAGMRVGDELVGILSVDNLISGKPITREDLEVLEAFAQQAAFAVMTRRLIATRDRYLEMGRRLTSLGAAIAGNTDVVEVLRMVRDAVRDATGVERVGVHLYDPRARAINAYWGTDRDGNASDERGNSWPVEAAENVPVFRIVSGLDPYVLSTDYTALLGLQPDHRMYGVRFHCVVPMRAGDEIVGVIGVDNLHSNAPITEDDVAVLLPFAEQAAVAVRNARLQSAQKLQVARLQELGRIAAAISSQAELSDMMLLVRNAIVETGMFDRAGVFLVDAAEGVARGTWGTDRDGKLEDIHDDVFAPDPSLDDPVHAVLRGSAPYVLVKDFSTQVGSGPASSMSGVRNHCTIGMRAMGAVVGAIAVDNLLTDRPISEADVALLLPFADQAAAAVQNYRMREQIEAANKDLEERVDQRTAELLALADEMAQFTYTISHDLRSPLRAVDGFAYLIQERYNDLLPSDARRDLDRIRNGAKQMGRRIDDLLGLVRLGRAQLVLRTVSPRSVAEETVAELRTRYPHAVSIRIADMPTCRADRDLLRIVYGNLISNAMKFTSGANLAEIEIGHRDGAYFVRDNGIGFDQKYAHTLFDVFRRYGRSDENEGTGSGLAFARRIVQMHGGRIWAESAPNAGATFYFTLGPDQTGK